MNVKLVLSAVALILCASCGRNNTVPAPDEKFSYPKEKLDSVSYIVGFLCGDIVRSNGGEFLDEDMLKKGMEDYLNAKGLPHTDEFDENFLVHPKNISRVIHEYADSLLSYKKRVNAVREAGWLEENSGREGVTVTESGLQYRILKKGNGTFAADTDTVKLKYSLRTMEGYVFDKREEPVPFVLPVRHIDGFKEAVSLLDEGGSGEFYIPSALAYGDRKMREIEPCTGLVLELEIAEIVKTAE